MAVDSLDLRVEPGTVLGFLGPNGAGKTTAIRMLTTILEPDAGTFAVGGIPHDRPVDIRRIEGVLPESAGYPHTQSAREWLVFHARLFGLSRVDAESTAVRLLAEVGLAERARSPVGSYSRGMRQRLGIARALINDPQVVFLDEPTLGLDPMGQGQVLDLVKRVAREHGVTVVISTHVLAEVEKVCGQVVILNRGRLVAQGTVSEVVKLAGTPLRGMVGVPPAFQQRAIEALASRQLAAVPGRDEHTGDLELTLPAGTPPETAGSEALRCLLDAGVPVLSFSLEGGRLSDAFLTVTAGATDV